MRVLIRDARVFTRAAVVAAATDARWHRAPRRSIARGGGGSLTNLVVAVAITLQTPLHALAIEQKRSHAAVAAAATAANRRHRQSIARLPSPPLVVPLNSAFTLGQQRRRRRLVSIIERERAQRDSSR